MALSAARRALIVTLYFAAFWLLLPWGCWRLGRALDPHLPALGPHPLAGGALALAGLVSLAWSMRELWVRGGGLPISALPPAGLVRTGPYRWSRHPIYLGFDLALCGVGLALGSAGLAAVAAGLLPAWVGYALLEERGLARRHGRAWRRYAAEVGLFPRLDLYPLVALVCHAARLSRLFPLRFEGRGHVPRAGAAVLVSNHACYLDPFLAGIFTWRRVHYPTTAEAYRAGLSRWALRHLPHHPVRRYGPDPAACRRLVRLIQDGEVIGVFPEGERSPLGAYQGAEPGLARILARLGAPVIPVAISGSFDCGPRWAGRLRCRRVLVRAGPPVEFDGRPPAEAIDRALRALLDDDPQPVHLSGLPDGSVAAVLWRCPACGAEPAWDARALSCAACGQGYRPTPEGWFEDGRARRSSLAELGERVLDWPEAAPLQARAVAAWEDRRGGPIRPLEPLGSGTLEADRRELRFETWRLPLTELRSVSTERGDVLQLASAARLWQFRLLESSVFRLAAAVVRWRREGRP